MEFVLLLLMIVSTIALMVVKFLKIAAAYVWVKGLASLFFVATGIVSYRKVRNNKKYFIFILTGLIFSFAGDVFLELSGIVPALFIIGVGSFAICHIMYSIGFCTLRKVELKDFFICLAIAIPMILLQTLGHFNFNGMKFIVMVYTILISFMVSKAISLRCFYKANKKAVIMTIAGAVMFLISDILLLFCFFGTSKYDLLGYMNNVIYYLGQGVLALSLSKKLNTGLKDITQYTPKAI